MLPADWLISTSHDTLPSSFCGERCYGIAASANVLCNFITLANIMAIVLLWRLCGFSHICNPCSQKLCDVKCLYDFRLCGVQESPMGFFSLLSLISNNVHQISTVNFSSLTMHLLVWLYFCWRWSGARLSSGGKSTSQPTNHIGCHCRVHPTFYKWMYFYTLAAARGETFSSRTVVTVGSCLYGQQPLL